MLYVASGTLLFLSYLFFRHGAIEAYRDYRYAPHTAHQRNLIMQIVMFMILFCSGFECLMRALGWWQGALSLRGEGSYLFPLLLMDNIKVLNSYKYSIPRPHHLCIEREKELTAREVCARWCKGMCVTIPSFGIPIGLLILISQILHPVLTVIAGVFLVPCMVILIFNFMLSYFFPI